MSATADGPSASITPVHGESQTTSSWLKTVLNKSSVPRDANGGQRLDVRARYLPTPVPQLRTTSHGPVPSWGPSLVLPPFRSLVTGGNSAQGRSCPQSHSVIESSDTALGTTIVVHFLKPIPTFSSGAELPTDILSQLQPRMWQSTGIQDPDLNLLPPINHGPPSGPPFVVPQNTVGTFEAHSLPPSRHFGDTMPLQAPLFQASPQPPESQIHWSMLAASGPRQPYAFAPMQALYMSRRAKTYPKAKRGDRNPYPGASGIVETGPPGGPSPPPKLLPWNTCVLPSPPPKPPGSLASPSCPRLEYAPASPRISVRPIRLEVEYPRGLSKKTPLRVLHGYGPTEGIELKVEAEFGKLVQRSNTPKSIEAKVGLSWRCRWDGCREMVPAIEDSIENHLKLAHGFHRELKNCHPWVASVSGRKGRRTRFQCRWMPAMLVELVDGSQVFVSTHNQSYLCGQEMDMENMVNHVGTHLHHESQPNPAAMCCEHCKGIYIGLRQHSGICPERPEPKSEVDNS